MKFLQEFKAFAMRGNVIDLAIAVVVGTAFSKIVSSFVDGIIMPVLSWLLSGINIASKSFAIGSVIIKWGLFFQAVLDFTIIAFSIFVVIKVFNTFIKEQGITLSKHSHQEKLLMEIRDLLRENLKKEE